ncbi:hypothetical protein SIM55_24580 [Bacillus cereus group sp. BfR-BA-02675]|uniref:hypothetical protein n=1 Tax=Bacillus cereus group TaxID=86661 RepID=UPI0029C2B8B0|nr:MULTISPECIES: hypothetical protein [unclassified Bacillus cereus group]MDX5768867.1 hypothetical protein [Bacillus cereus group sp. BfR-BA-02675]MDX5891078.1 hypothetical protein [Bacillus cereus group sp. BfR-BA-01039]
MNKNIFLVKSNKRWADYILGSYHYENFKCMEDYVEKEKELYEIDVQLLKQYIARIEAIQESYDVAKLQPLIIMYVTILFSVFTATVTFSKEIWGFIVLIILISIILPYVVNIIVFARNRWTKLVYLKKRFEQIQDEREK